MDAIAANAVPDGADQRSPHDSRDDARVQWAMSSDEPSVARLTERPDLYDFTPLRGLGRRSRGAVASSGLFASSGLSPRAL